MFDNTTAELLEQIETLTEAAKLSDVVREEAARLSALGGPRNAFENALVAGAPPLGLWRVYDHCAMVTRIYSVLDVFISSLARDVCDAYPRYRESYSKLPERVRKAHRVGFGKIILEIEEKRYHRTLDQADLVTTYLDGFNGTIPYRLIPEAFLAAKRALRFPELLAILNTLGFDEVEQKLAGHPFLRPYLADVPPAERKGSLQKRLDEFIDARNEAAHSAVSNTWATDRLFAVAYFVRDICLAIADIGATSFARRSLDLGMLTKIGRVTEVYGGGYIVVVQSDACTVGVGTEVVVCHAEGTKLGLIVSVEINDASVEGATVSAGSELGLNVTVKCHENDEIFLRSENQEITQVIIPEESAEEVVDPASDSVHESSEVDVELN